MTTSGHIIKFGIEPSANGTEPWNPTWIIGCVPPGWLWLDNSKVLKTEDPLLQSLSSPSQSPVCKFEPQDLTRLAHERKFKGIDILIIHRLTSQ